jgi:hypothetical protein
MSMQQTNKCQTTLRDTQSSGGRSYSAVPTVSNSCNAQLHPSIPSSLALPIGAPPSHYFLTQLTSINTHMHHSDLGLSGVEPGLWDRLTVPGIRYEKNGGG